MFKLPYHQLASLRDQLDFCTLLMAQLREYCYIRLHTLLAAAAPDQHLEAGTLVGNLLNLQLAFATEFATTVVPTTILGIVMSSQKRHGY